MTTSSYSAADESAQARSWAGSFRSGLSQYAGFIPAALLFGGLFVLPLLLIVGYSFWEVVDYRVVPNWTLDNYTYLASVPTYVRTALATAWVAIAATALTILLAFPLAYWLVRRVPKRWQKFLLVLVILPFWTSYLLRVYVWVGILGDQGAINRLLQAVGITDEPVSFFLYDRPAVILVLVYLYFPFAVLALYSVLERFDWHQLRAAQDLGAKPIRAFRRVILPQVKVGITTAVVFVMIPILGEYLAPQLVGGTRGVMIGNLVVNFFQSAQYSRGAALALVIALVVLLLLLLLRRGLYLQYSITAGGEGRIDAEPPLNTAQRVKRRLLDVYAFGVYFFLFAPILLLVVFSFNANPLGTFPITGWTTQWYGDVMENLSIQDALLTSIKVAVAVTAVSTFVGTCAAFPLVRSRLPFRGAVRVAFAAPMMIPGLLVGVAILSLITGLLTMRLSTWTAVAGQAVWITPFVTLIVAARLDSFDRSLESAAADLGANTLRRLRYVVLPLIAPAIYASALLAFTLSLDEFIITLFLIGGENTLPIYIFTQVKLGPTPEVNALITLMLAASLILLGLAALTLRVTSRLRGAQT